MMTTMRSTKRFALLIGNSTYGSFPHLPNVINDVERMKTKLEFLGFKVTPCTDQTLSEMLDAIEQFRNEVRVPHDKIDIVVFYAGHGCNIGGNNYLIPINGGSITDVGLASRMYIDIDWVISLLAENRGSRHSPIIGIFDCCRLKISQRNPSRSDFKRVEGEDHNVFVMQAALRGQAALEGTGENGAFTEHLLRHIDTGDNNIHDITKKVRIDVQIKTSGNQTTWSSDSLLDNFWFKQTAMKIPTGTIQIAKAQHITQTLTVSERLEYYARKQGFNLAKEDGPELDVSNRKLIHAIVQIQGVDYDVIELLRDKYKVDVNTKKHDDEWTPLHFASEKGLVVIVKALIKLGADLNAKSSTDWTPLHVAADRGEVDVARALVDGKADINAQTNNKDTPLHLAAEKNRDDMVAYLVQLNPKPKLDSPNADSWTPLHKAALKGHEKIVKRLAVAGAYVDCRGRNGETPLHLAVEHKWIDVMKTLKVAKADTAIDDISGVTPIGRARTRGVASILK